MDEASRSLERAAAQGDANARVRLANEKLRAEDPAAALRLLDGTPTTGLQASTRALALARLGDEREALVCLESAIASGLGDLDPRIALEALEPTLIEPVPLLGRARAARVLARMGVRDHDLARRLERLASDEDNVVRLACLTERPRYEAHDRTTRVYGSHGPDYESGYFVSFEATLELRLRTFDAKMFCDVEEALASISKDRHFGDRPDPFVAAFGDGYGLAGDSGPISLRERADAVSELVRLDLLPFRVVFSTGPMRPYDVMTSEAKLARRLGRDLLSYPARQKPFDANGTLLERFLASHPLRGDSPQHEKIAPLLEEARVRYTKTGVQALEEFRKFLKGAERGFF